MGRITIDIQGPENHHFAIHDTATIDRLLKALAAIVERERDEEDDILGLWTPPAEIVGKKATEQ